MIPNQPTVEGTRLTFTMEAIVMNPISRSVKRPNHPITPTMFVSIRTKLQAKVFWETFPWQNASKKSSSVGR